MDLSIKYILIILAVLLVILVLFFYFSNSDEDVVNFNDGSMFMEEYESLNDEKTMDNKKYPRVDIGVSNKIKYLTIGEVLNILDNGTAVIYIGYAECLYCRSAVQVLLDTAKEMELKNIYYLDISNVWDIKEVDADGNVVIVQEADINYVTLLEEIGEEYTEDYILKDKANNIINANEKRLKVPLVIFIVDGNIVSSNVGTLFSQDDPYMPLSDAQVRGLSEIYSYGIKDVLDGLKIK